MTLALGTFKIPIYKYEEQKKVWEFPFPRDELIACVQKKQHCPLHPLWTPQALSLCSMLLTILRRSLRFFHRSNASTSTTTATPAALTEQSSALAVMTLLPRVASCFPWCEITRKYSRSNPQKTPEFPTEILHQPLGVKKIWTLSQQLGLFEKKGRRPSFLGRKFSGCRCFDWLVVPTHLKNIS